MITYQITTHRLKRNLDKFIVGFDIASGFYVYGLYILRKDAVFCGTAKEVLDKLLDKEFLSNATK